MRNFHNFPSFSSWVYSWKYEPLLECLRDSLFVLNFNWHARRKCRLRDEASWLYVPLNWQSSSTGRYIHPTDAPELGLDDDWNGDSKLRNCMEYFTWHRSLKTALCVCRVGQLHWPHSCEFNVSPFHYYAYSIPIKHIFTRDPVWCTNSLGTSFKDVDSHSVTSQLSALNTRLITHLV